MTAIITAAVSALSQISAETGKTDWLINRITRMLCYFTLIHGSLTFWYSQTTSSLIKKPLFQRILKTVVKRKMVILTDLQ